MVVATCLKCTCLGKRVCWSRGRDVPGTVRVWNASPGGNASCAAPKAWPGCGLALCELPQPDRGGAEAQAVPAVATGALGAVPSGSPPRTCHSAWQRRGGRRRLPVMEPLWAVLALHPQQPGGSCCQPILQMMQLRSREDCAVGHTPASIRARLQPGRQSTHSAAGAQADVASGEQTPVAAAACPPSQHRLSRLRWWKLEGRPEIIEKQSSMSLPV